MSGPRTELGGRVAGSGICEGRLDRPNELRINGTATATGSALIALTNFVNPIAVELPGPAAEVEHDDGDRDLYVTCLEENFLYRNNGDGTFEDVTDEAGVGGGKAWSASACFLPDSSPLIAAGAVPFPCAAIRSVVSSRSSFRHPAEIQVSCQDRAADRSSMAGRLHVHGAHP